jgi:hypothetical protein
MKYSLWGKKYETKPLWTFLRAARLRQRIAGMKVSDAMGIGCLGWISYELRDQVNSRGCGVI